MEFTVEQFVREHTRPTNGEMRLRRKVVYAAYIAQANSVSATYVVDAVRFGYLVRKYGVQGDTRHWYLELVNCAQTQFTAPKIQQFIRERTRASNAETPTRRNLVYSAYMTWALMNDGPTLNAQQFGMLMRKCGVKGRPFYWYVELLP